MPDIEADRSKFDIVSFPIEPGDIVVFHPSTIHGGAAIREGNRRTVTFRFFGDDVEFARPVAGRMEPNFSGVMSSGLRPGDPLRHSWFPQVYPRAGRTMALA